MKIYEQEDFMRGNVVSNTQFSNYIRCKQETECNGFTNPEGHLQQHDIKVFPRYVPYWHRSQACRHANERGESVILYCIRHRTGDNVIVKGYILTTKDHKLIYSICERSPYSRAIVNMAVKQLTEGTSYGIQAA